MKNVAFKTITLTIIFYLLILSISARAQCNAYAGQNFIICETDHVYINNSSANNYQSLYWTSSGSGHFIQSDTLNPEYIPSSQDIANGSVRLELHIIPLTYCDDTISQVSIYIVGLPEINVGNSDTICEQSSYYIETSYSQNVSYILWSTSGDGSFNNPNIINPIYYPGISDISNGYAILTVGGNSISPCFGSVFEHMRLDIISKPQINIGRDTLICENQNLFIANAILNNANTIVWKTSGDGVFNNTNIAHPIYYPGINDISIGNVSIIAIANGIYPCSATSDTLNLSFQNISEVDAGIDFTICETPYFQIFDANITNYSSIRWTTSGTGTFNNNTILNPIYYPSSSDITNVNVTLTLSAQNISPCMGFERDSKTLFFTPAPRINAGPDTSACGNMSFPIEDATASNYVSLKWTTNGTGFFVRVNSINTIYNPSLADIDSGFVILTLTAYGYPLCDSVSDSRIIYLNLGPNVNAGPNATICQGSIYNILFSSASNYTTLLWTSSGSGRFSNIGTLHPTYTPSSGDIQAGSVTLTLRPGGVGVCDVISSDMILTINRFNAIAGNDGRICPGEIFPVTGADAINYTNILWTTSGTGSFLNNGTLLPTYIPSALDEQTASIILTMNVYAAAPCNIISDQLILYIDQNTTANAGVDYAICAGPHRVTTATATGYSTVTWSSTGTGTLINSNTLSPTYTPSAADISNGSVTLTLIAYAFCAGYGTATDELVLSIIQSPITDAGENGIICEAETFTPSGASANHNSSVHWSTSGSGSFSNNGTLSPTYTPSSSDIAAGNVTLTISAYGTSPCNVVTDNLSLIIQKLPIAIAGDDATICENQTFTVRNARPTNYSTIEWTTTGTGTLVNSSYLTPIYTPSTFDINNGSVILKLRVTAILPCSGFDEDEMQIFFVKKPIVDAGSNATICSNVNYTIFDANVINYSSVHWVSSGNGYFTGNNTLNPTYYPGSADISNGSVIISLHAIGNTPCSEVVDNMTLYVTSMPIINSGLDVTSCNNSPVTISTASANAYSSVFWSSSGTGVLINENTLNPTYTPSLSDIAIGSVSLTMTANSIDPPCSGYVHDEMMIFITPLATVEAGEDTVICELNYYTVTDARAHNYSMLQWTSSGTGTFINNGSIHPTYVPSSNDIQNGFVELTIKSYNLQPCTGYQFDVMRLNIRHLPDISAGNDTMICEGNDYSVRNAIADNYTNVYWSSSGTGYFTDNNTLFPIYHPSTNDIQSGSVRIILHALGISPCGWISDESVLTIIKKPSLNITVSSADVCIGTNYSITSASAINYSSIIWTTNGTGTFTNNNALNTTYQPSNADYLDGHIMLYARALSMSPCISYVIDSLKLVFIIAPIVNAGTDIIICEGQTVNITNAIASNYTSINWLSQGTGVLQNTNGLNPSYIPSNNDILNGYVILTLQATGNSPCTYSSDQMRITINRPPRVNAGADLYACNGNAFTLSQATASNYSSISWTSSGTGFFSNNGSLSPTYTASVADIQSGSVLLTLHADAQIPCNGYSADNMILRFIPLPNVNIGNDTVICSNVNIQMNNVSVSNYNNIQWSTTGTGSFSNINIINPTYYPSASDVVMGNIILRLTAYSNSPCNTPLYDEIIVQIISSPSIQLTNNNVSICNGQTYTVSGVNALNYSSINWTSSGSGTFTQSSSVTPTYIPSLLDYSNGSVTLTITALHYNACNTNATEHIILSFVNSSNIHAGSNDTVCSQSPYLLYANGSNYTSVIWTSNGTGYFLNANTINATYIASIADAIIGNVTITITASPLAPCFIESSDALILNVVPFVDVEAGNNITICEGNSVQLSNSTAENYSSIFWTTSGSGTFSNIYSLHPYYNPSLTDISNGNVQLTLNGQSIAPCNQSDNSNIIITIQAKPTVSAGSDVSICYGADYEITNATVYNYSSLVWTSSGSGHFINNSTINPTYIPSVNDYLNGSVLLTITAYGLVPCTISVVDQMVLAFVQQPIAEAGSDVTICEGTQAHILNSFSSNHLSLLWTSTGSGNFINQTSINPFYNPSQQDIINGSVVLRLSAYSSTCATQTDSMILSIQPIGSVSAGPDQTICENGVLNISTASLLNVTNILWLTSGSGVFVNENTLTPIYIPSQQDINAGIVILSMNANSLSPCNGVVFDRMNLNIQKLPNVYSGSNQTICSNQSYLIQQSSIQNTSSIQWLTSGTGIFNFNNILHPTYTPSVGDIVNGRVELILTAQSISPCNIIASDTFTLTIISATIVSAGIDDTICQGMNYTLSNATHNNASSFLWTSSGSGVFSNSSILNPTYVPSMADINNGIVILRLNANGNYPCSNVYDDVILTIRSHTTLFAGRDTSICENSNYLLSGAFVSNANSFSWTSNGTGILVNDNTLTPTYYPSSSDIINGQVIITLTTYSLIPCSIVLTDQFTLSFNRLPYSNAGNSASICQNNNYNLRGTISNSASFSWSSLGSGTFVNANTLFPSYIPSVLDIQNGRVVISLTANGYGNCVAYTDTMVINIQRRPIANAGMDDNVCENNSYQIIHANAIDYSTIYWTTSGTGSFTYGNTINSIYTPSAGDIILGSVILTLNVVSANPCIGTVTDNLVLNITHLPISNAGNDDYVCSGGSYQLRGNASNYSALEWTTSGTGMFTNQNQTNAIYIPSAADISSGMVMLTLNVFSISPPCNNNSVRDYMFLRIERLPSIIASQDTIICFGENAMLSASGGVNYLWNTNPTQSTPNIVVAPFSTTNYTVFVTNAMGCRTTENVLVTVNKIIVNTSSDTLVCFGDLAFLHSNGQGGSSPYTYIWNDNASLNNNRISNPIVTSTLTNTYELTVKDNIGCIGYGDVTVYVNPLLTVSLINDTLLCYGRNMQLIPIVNGGSPNYYFTWNSSYGMNDSTYRNPLVSPLIPYDYSVTVTDHYGCYASDYVFINVIKPIALFITEERSTCEIDGIIHFVDLSTVSNSIINSWEWNFNDGNISNLQNPNHTYQHDGNYDVSLTVTTTEGCSNTLSLQEYIQVFPNPIVNFTFSPSRTTELDPYILFNNISYSPLNFNLDSAIWNFGDGVIDINPIYNPFNHYYNDDGSYEVMLSVIDQNGCRSSISHNVEIQPGFTIYVPNAFTPNGDVNNGTFKAYGIDLNSKQFEMFVYDRFGNIIFHSNDSELGWDGTANGDEAEEGAYIWEVRLKNIENLLKIYRGYTNLIR